MWFTGNSTDHLLTFFWFEWHHTKSWPMVWHQNVIWRHVPSQNNVTWPQAFSFLNVVEEKNSIWIFCDTLTQKCVLCFGFRIISSLWLLILMQFIDHEAGVPCLVDTSYFIKCSFQLCTVVWICYVMEILTLVISALFFQTFVILVCI